ncbi:AAA family ATPase [Reinekea blandensis]|uniref:Putative GTP-binding protein n=1 Tax=Reinekea blandensis MED297 TaxID=314283 RepID=A4BFN9_9GAMM|nr:AAA family ATPase [Reinekea blandensis]EAR09134.1 putative GTP-binding protein [Reinekea sp. MED297] [Reinekea blandensis MED297]
MKLTRVSIDSVRQFREPLTLENLAEGLNLFVGPNESGKSTLVSAIRAAFFERYKSNSVKDLQPWGDSSAAPSVSIAFEWQNQSWQLDKRFLKRQRCDLKTPSETLNGEEAEERLAELLGYGFSGRGASKAENWGIPGLLWVEQGQVQNIQEPVDHASTHLQSVLSNQLGDVASTQGDALIDRIEAQSKELLTATGQPNKFLKGIIQADDDAQAKLSALQDDVRQYNDQVDELGRLQSQQQEQDHNQPWNALRKQADQARGQLQEARQWQQQQQSQKQTRHEVTRQIELTREKLQGFEDQSERLQQRAQAHQQALQQRESCAAREPVLKKSLETAKQAEQDARQRAQQARQSNRTLQLRQSHQQVQAQCQDLTDKLTKAEALDAQIAELSQQQAMLVVDADALTALQQSERKREQLILQQEALASRLSFNLQENANVRVNGDAVSGQGERALVARTTVDIEGVGSISFEPGGSDLAELQRQTENVTAKRDDALQRLSVASLDEAEQNAEQHRSVTQALEAKRTELRFFAPKGLEELRRERQQLHDQQAQLNEQLSTLPDIAEAEVDVDRAERLLEEAGDALKQVEADWNAYQLELAQAQHHASAAEQEWQRLSEQLSSPEQQALKEQTQQELIDLQARDQSFQNAIAALQEKIDNANPDLLEQDIQRLTQSADSQEADARERTRQIDRLQTLLEQVGATGLGEKLDDAQRAATQAQQRRVELERRAEALWLLLEQLRSARHRLTQKLQAPLQKHLNHYLRLLFPGAELTVDDQLRPEQLQRKDQDRADMTTLSYGAQEQMGLICRLAYADLLKEAGRPTLIILDDALVHSDRERLDQMKRILFDAATRHQVLLFSCHPENWRDLGVAAVDLQALKAQPSALRLE